MKGVCAVGRAAAERREGTEQELSGAPWKHAWRQGKGGMYPVQSFGFESGSHLVAHTGLELTSSCPCFIDAVVTG